MSKSELRLDKNKLLYLISVGDIKGIRETVGYSSKDTFTNLQRYAELINIFIALERIELLPQVLKKESEEPESILNIAILYDHLLLFNAALSKGESINKSGLNGNTPLIFAAFHSHLNFVQLILSEPNVKLDAQNKWGCTALHYADQEIYSSLISLGADQFIKDEKGGTALERIKKLLKDQPNIVQSFINGKDEIVVDEIKEEVGNKVGKDLNVVVVSGETDLLLD